MKRLGLSGRKDITANELEGLGFEKIGFPEDKFHTWGEGNENNQKWVLKEFENSGRYGTAEIIVAPGNVDSPFIDLMSVTDPNVMGTYNFGASIMGHVIEDVIPYYVWGNSPEDTTSFSGRLGRTFAGKGE
ncbi:MAG: hypothetical protein U5M23_00830 [Marinagarivorans sp.]|nr:hypothetical protein [Marinagarivorans sp.]